MKLEDCVVPALSQSEYLETSSIMMDDEPIATEETEVPDADDTSSIQDVATALKAKYDRLLRQDFVS